MHTIYSHKLSAQPLLLRLHVNSQGDSKLKQFGANSLDPNTVNRRISNWEAKFPRGFGNSDEDETERRYM